MVSLGCMMMEKPIYSSHKNFGNAVTATGKATPEVNLQIRCQYCFAHFKRLADGHRFQTNKKTNQMRFFFLLLFCFVCTEIMVETRFSIFDKFILFSFKNHSLTHTFLILILKTKGLTSRPYF